MKDAKQLLEWSESRKQVESKVDERENKKTAEESYKENQKKADKLMKSLAGKLKSHAKKQSARPKDWGFVGDVGHVVELLQEADDFFN